MKIDRKIALPDSRWHSVVAGYDIKVWEKSPSPTLEVSPVIRISPSLCLVHRGPFYVGALARSSLSNVADFWMALYIVGLILIFPQDSTQLLCDHSVYFFQRALAFSPPTIWPPLIRVE